MKVAAVGIPWYRPEHYAQLVSMFDDGQNFPKQYEQWIRLAEATQTQLEKKGHKVVRAFIDPENFLSWCASQRLPHDARARIAFANLAALSIVADQH